MDRASMNGERDMRETGEPHAQGVNAAASGNSAEHTPQDIRWQAGRDPDRNWAITRAQPIASLVVAGDLWGFSRSVAPPTALIGKRLMITAGGSHHPFKEADESGWKAVLDHCGQRVSPAEIASGKERMFREAVHGLPTSESLGAVRLAAAFQIAHVVEGRVYADIRPGGPMTAPRQMGIWQEFDKRPLPKLEKLVRGRWMWCFDRAHTLSEPLRTPMKGFGGIWDYDLGRQLRQREAR